MKLKLIGSLFVALIFYLITILINLFQFNPLPVVFRSGLKISITAFVFTLVLSFVLEYFKDDNIDEIEKKGNKAQEGKQPKGKVSEKYKTSNKNSTKQKATNNQSSDINNNNSSKVNKKREEEFNEIKPPVIEYEEK